MCHFRLRAVVPHPLEGQYSPSSEIWACEYSLERGKRYLVSASSGKGKTTLQHLLYGLRDDYTGHIYFSWAGKEKLLSELSLDEWAELRQRYLSVVFQDLRLFPQLSALENILLKNQLQKHKSKAEIEGMAEQLGMAAFLHKEAGLLSYGQKQRIAIIRALCQPFAFLLLDEPFAHLDQENIDLCKELIENECKKQGASYLLASLGENYGIAYHEIKQL